MTEAAGFVVHGVAVVGISDLLPNYVDARHVHSAQDIDQAEVSLVYSAPRTVVEIYVSREVYAVFGAPIA